LNSRSGCALNRTILRAVAEINVRLFAGNRKKVLAVAGGRITAHNRSGWRVKVNRMPIPACISYFYLRGEILVRFRLIFEIRISTPGNCMRLPEVANCSDITVITICNFTV